MSKKARTLNGEEIINATGEDMWCYGTSGELIKLKRVEPQTLREPGYFPNSNAYYVVDDNMRDFLENNPKYKGKLLRATFTGRARGGEELYRCYNENDLLVQPITDRAGVANKPYHDFHPGDCLLKLEM